jgi:PAS domain S-box-containing protein
VSAGGETARFPSNTDAAPGGGTASTRPGSAHLVQFYEAEPVLAGAVAKFIADGLCAGDVVTTIATGEHTRAIHGRLRADGVDVDLALASGRLLSIDAHETLAKLLRDGVPDRHLFEDVIGGLVADRAAVDVGARLRAYGEMVDILWKQGDKSAALHLEELWNDLQARRPFTLLCAYAMGPFYKEPASIHGVCAAHNQIVLPAHDGEPRPEGDSANRPSPYAQALAREILHREEVELALRQSLRDLRSKEEQLRESEVQLRESEEQLRESEVQLRDFVENATVGLHRVDADGRILWANRAELEVLGYTADEYIGRSIAEFHVDPDVIADILARLLRGEALHDYEARLRAKDGAIKHVLLSSSGYFRDGRFVHSRCFTRDITERRRAEQAVRDSERQLQLVTDALPVCVSYIDRQGRYRFVSAAYERWFGRSKEDLLGKRVEDVIGVAAYEIVGPYMDRALAGEPVTYQGDVPYLDGIATRSIEATYIPQFGKDQRVVGIVALVSDISERKGFERFRAAAAVRAERLVKVTAALADAVTTDEVLEAVVDEVAAALGAANVALWLVDESAETVALARSIGFDEATVARFATVSLHATPSIPVLDAVRRAEPIWIPSQAAMLRDYPHLRDATRLQRPYRVACLPLGSSGRPVAVLAITIDEAGEASEDERSFLLLVARYTGQALERLRLLEAERKSRADADAAANRLSLLSQASRAFGEAALDLDARLHSVAAALSTALDSSVNVALIEPDGLLHLTAVHHPVPEAHDLLVALAPSSPLRIGEGITGTIAATGESVLVPRVEAQHIAARAPAPYRAFLERYPVYALIGVPLRVRGRIIGTVTAARCREDQSFTADDLKLLDELAERAAVAIENARLHRETVNGRARAEQLYRFAQAIVAADQVEVVFDAALTAIEAALGTTRAAILLFDADGVMRFKASRHLSDNYRRAVEGHSPWPRDAVGPQPVLVTDVQTDASLQAFLPLFHEEGIGSLAFIPLVTRGRLVGKFMVYYGRAHHYSEQEVELAVSIANHVASVAARFAAISKLEDTIRYNELFAGVLAHDLRNPVGAMMTAAQTILMRGEERPERNAKSASRIMTSGQRVTRMIDQMLDVTRARVGGGIELELRATNLTDLCNQAVGEVELAFPQWTIRRESIGELDGTWDPDRLLQIISNLLSNAGQHGQPEGVVEIRLDGRDPDIVTLAVHNGGVIPPSLLPTLFDPFRGTRQRRDASRGLGLGLYIVKEIAQAHGGAVEVSSQPESGTTFLVQLPRRTSRSSASDRHVFASDQ